MTSTECSDTASPPRDEELERASTKAHVQRLFGPDCDQSNEAIILVLFILTHPAVDHEAADFATRVERLRTELGLDTTVAERAAGEGFVATGRGCAGCAVCSVEVSPDGLRSFASADRSRWPGHASDCLFRLLRCSGGDQLRPVRHLLRHLHAEWCSTKATVARDMGYSDDSLAFALAAQFQRYGRPFANAGDLVDVLFSLEYEEAASRVPRGAAPVLKSALGIDRKLPAKPSTPSLIPTPPASQQASLETPTGKQWHGPEPFQPQPVHAAPELTTDGKAAPGLYEETLQLLFRWRCKGCGQADAERLIADCGHLALCADCEKRHHRCPLCQTQISQCIRVYPS